MPSSVTGTSCTWCICCSVPVKHILLLQAAVYSVAFDGVNGLIASGSKDKTVRLWHPTV